jgi:hypothetical protein
MGDDAILPPGVGCSALWLMSASECDGCISRVTLSLPSLDDARGLSEVDAAALLRVWSGIVYLLPETRELQESE